MKAMDASSGMGELSMAPTKAASGGFESLPKEMRETKIRDDKDDQNDDKVLLPPARIIPVPVCCSVVPGL